jgi:hypothetical protein
MTAQLPGLKKQNLKASDYSKRTIQGLFKPEILSTTLVRAVEVSESVIAVNEGNGKFSIVVLPDQVQWSCVCGIACTDINSDGNLDMILGGNNFDFKPQFSQQDASYGQVLLGDGKMNFALKNSNESGFLVRGQVRHIKLFTDKKGNRYVVVAINNEKPRVLRINRQGMNL